MRIAVAYAQYDSNDIPWLLKMLDEYFSFYELRWCIETLRLYIDRVPRREKTQIVEILDRHWIHIQGDPKCLESARQLVNSIPESTRDVDPTQKAAEDIYKVQESIHKSERPAETPTPDSIKFAASSPAIKIPREERPTVRVDGTSSAPRQSEDADSTPISLETPSL